MVIVWAEACVNQPHCGNRLHCTHLSNHYILHAELTTLHVNHMSIKLERKRKDNKIQWVGYFRQRRRERERERGRETSVCGCLSPAPYWGPGPKPRHMPWLGIQTATLWFAGRRSIHWATAARAEMLYNIKCEHSTGIIKRSVLKYLGVKGMMPVTNT